MVVSGCDEAGRTRLKHLRNVLEHDDACSEQAKEEDSFGGAPDELEDH